MSAYPTSIQIENPERIAYWIEYNQKAQNYAKARLISMRKLKEDGIDPVNFMSYELPLDKDKITVLFKKTIVERKDERKDESASKTIEKRTYQIIDLRDIETLEMVRAYDLRDMLEKDKKSCSLM